MRCPPTHQLIISFAIIATNYDRLDFIGIRQQLGQKLHMVVGAIPPRGEEHGEQVGTQMQRRREIVRPIFGIKYFNR